MNWNLLQSFVAVVEEGSLAKAGARLGLSQPTVGRHVDELEREIDVTLFERTRTGFQVTEAGLAILEHARAMRDAAGALARVAAGRAEEAGGTVRVTASEMMAVFVLPPVFAAMRAALPEIELELAATDTTANLLHREADIAVRMVRPEQADIVTRKLGEVRMGLYAHRDYLARRGRPQDFADLAGHDVIGYDRSDLIIRGARQMGFDIDRTFFSLRSDSQAACWTMLTAGWGVGFAQRNLADKEPELVRLMPDLALPTLPVWLTAHREVRTSRRIRLVFDFLASAISRLKL